MSNSGAQPASQDDLTLGDFMAMLRRRRVSMAVCVLLAVLLGAAYTLLATPVYESTTVIRVESEQVNLPQVVQQVPTENRIGTEIEMLRGASAAAAVIDSLGLRARLLAPGRARLSEYFSLLRVAPATDTLTLVLRIAHGGRLTVERSGIAVDTSSAQAGDTVQVAGVTFALARAARDVPELRLQVVSMGSAIRAFGSALKVSRPSKDADLITVGVRAADPVQATAAANLLAQQLITGRQGVQVARAGSTIRFLQQQLDTLKFQLRVAEDTLRAYRERARVVDVEEEARTQVGHLAQIQADRGALEAERQALALLLRQMRSDSSRGLPGGQSAAARRLMSFPTLLRNPVASELLGALAQLENQRSAMLVQGVPQDPDVKRLTARIHELEAQLQGIAETYLQGLTNQVASLEGVARGFGVALDSVPEKEVHTARLEREVAVQQELFTLIQTRLKEAQITQAMEDPTLRIVDHAVVPERPVQPRPLLNLAIALALGTVLGAVTSFGREVTDRSVRSRADVLLATGIPVLGAVPRLERRLLHLLPRASRRRHTHHPHRGPLYRAGQRLRRAISGSTNGTGISHGSHRAAARIASLLVTRPDMPVAYLEAFNQLHANLALAFQGLPLKTVVFTSPLPGEGKTLSAVNFALTLAAGGLRVLLIDADLRRGLVNAVFGYAREPGFVELLAGSAPFEAGARRVGVGETGELMILPSGALPSTPGQLLGVERVREVLESLAPQFDLVLIDSPPINLLADAALLGSVADAVLLVVRARHTRIEALRYAIDQLNAVRAPVVGTLLNDIDVRRHSADDGSYRYLTEVEHYYAGRS